MSLRLSEFVVVIGRTAREECNLFGKSIWVPCPNCKQWTKTKVYEDTVLLKFPLFCQKCKKETRVNVVKLKMTISNEPDA